MEGLERIKVLASEVKDNDLLKIVDYLLSRNDMDEKYLNAKKSLTQMVKFINDTAKSEIDKKKKNNGFAGSFFSDDVVFGWAIHYWDESNETLGLAKKEKTEEKPNKEEVENTKVEEKKDNEVNNKKKWASEGQLTLFDFM